MAGDNREIGRFILDGIPPAPRGVPQVEVTFDIDANGILSVGATDKASGKEQSIRIEGSGGLDKGEIDRMVREAESHADEDRQRKDLVEKRNNLDSLVYRAEKMLGENAEALSPEDKQRIESALADAKQDLESEDLARLDAALQRVEQELHKVAEVLYKAQAEQAGPQPGGPGAGAAPGDPPSDDGDIVDAEYTEEKGDG